MKIASAWLLAALALCAPACAVAGDALDPQVRYGRYYEAIVVNEDGAAAESYEWSKTILKETALERSKSAAIGYSTSAQKAEVIAAYTLKADGRRIDVPKDNYQVEVNKGQGKDSPVLKIANDSVSYTASYTLKSNVLTVSARWMTHQRQCLLAQVMAEYKKVADRVVDNLDEQVLYK